MKLQPPTARLAVGVFRAQRLGLIATAGISEIVRTEAKFSHSQPDRIPRQTGEHEIDLQ